MQVSSALQAALALGNKLLCLEPSHPNHSLHEHRILNSPLHQTLIDTVNGWHLKLCHLGITINLPKSASPHCHFVTVIHATPIRKVGAFPHLPLTLPVMNLFILTMQRAMPATLCWGGLVTKESCIIHPKYNPLFGGLW